MIVDTETVDLSSKTIEELLLLIGDKEKGHSNQAFDCILNIGVAQVYSAIEAAVRNDDNADIRNGAMEVLVAMGKQILPQLLILLEDSNEEVRNFATVMLGEISSRDAVPALIQALRDTDVNVQHGAAEALGKIGDHGALAPLMELLKGDFWLQYPAIIALGEMRDKRAVPQLLELLRNEFLVQPIIEALGKIGDKRALFTLCSTLAEHSDFGVSGAAAQAIVAICTELNAFGNSGQAYLQFQEQQLQHVFDEEGLAKLKQLLQEGDVNIIPAAITLLGWLREESVLPQFVLMLRIQHYQQELEEAIFCFGKVALPVLVTTLASGDEEVKRVAVRLIGRLGEGVELEPLAKLVADPDQAVQREVLSALSGYQGAALLPELVELVRSGNEEISYRASELLGQYPFCTYQDFVQELINSSDPELRKRGAIVAGHGGPEVFGSILNKLATDAEAAVRIAVAQSFGIRKESSGIRPLLELLRDASEDVRAEAVLSLAEFEKHVPVKELSDSLKTAPEQLAAALVKAIGRTGSDEGGELLLQYLTLVKVSQSNMMMITISTLGKMCFQPATAALTEIYRASANPDIRRLTIEALGNIIDPLADEAIRVACADPHWSVRIAALHSLVKFPRPGAISFLTEVLNDNDLMVRKNAAICLGKTKDIDAIAPLAEHLVDHETGRYAFAALTGFGKKALPVVHRMLEEGQADEVVLRLLDVVGTIGDRKSVKRLLPILDNPSPPLRLAAIDALIFCFDGTVLKKLSHLKLLDSNIQVKDRADLALRALTTERFF